MSPFTANVSLRLALAVLACSARPCFAADAPPRMLGSLSCASASCHGQTSADSATRSPRRQEYHRWLESDPHAGAARTVGGAKFAGLLSALAGSDTALRTQVYARCAACHDPQGVAANAKAHPAAAQPIGCESCHGPAEHWLARHYERDVARQELRELGLVDTKDLLVRGRQCAGCHSGDGQHDLNHDMLAAGHPPLRFELSAYHDKIGRKHWTDAERIETPHFKAQLWAAGQIVQADGTLALLQSRATRAAENASLTPWPELAEFDCFACHQRLRPSPSSVAFKARPGIPGWQPWNLALAERLQADREIASVREHLGQPLLADPAETARLAAAARDAIRQHGDPATFTGPRIAALVKESVRPDQSWAESCQQLLALQAAYLARRDEVRKSSPTLRLVSTQASPRFGAPLDSHDEELQRRLANLTAALRFGSTDFDWPAYDWQGLPPLAQPPALAGGEAIARELALLAEELQ